MEVMLLKNRLAHFPNGCPPTYSKQKGASVPDRFTLNNEPSLRGLLKATFHHLTIKRQSQRG